MAEFIKVWADTETGSECNLKSAGVYAYAEHPSTHMQLFSYAFDDGPVKLWDLTREEEIPDDLAEAFDNPKYIFYFFNAQFDRLIIEQCLGIYRPIQKYRCLMAQALSHALPGSLEKWEESMGVKSDFQKIKDGKRLVQKFCKPRKQKDGTLKWSTPKTDPDEWELYKKYCVIDTAGMREAAKKTPNWNYPKETELSYWFMDQERNDRGMDIDIELVNAAVQTIEEEQKELAVKTKDMTNNEVATAGQRDAMLKHILKQYGLALDDMKKSTVEKIVDDDSYPEPLRELLRVRLNTCTTSTAKYKRLLKVISSGNKLRGTIMYAGASRTLRDCLAENTLVTVLTAFGSIEEKPIQFVDISDQLWDGLEWVAHEGVISKGVKKVIEYENICATPDHVVYLEDGTSVRLEEAKILGIRIWEPKIQNI
jgi:DNA polymerase